jgi:hypothetical protein
MEITLSTASIFVLGAFAGALVGRLVTFGLLALCLLIMLIKS